MAPTKQNSARAKILRALADFGMLPVIELAAASCLSASQARDNANHAVNDGLATKGRDDVTNSLAYKITAAGRAYLAGICLKAEKELSEAAAPCGEHQIDSRAQFLRTEMRQALARTYPLGNTCAHVDDSSGVDDAESPSDVLSRGSSCEVQTPISVDAIDATEPAPAPEQYAICLVGQAHLSAWPLRDMTIEAARQLAIDDAAAVGGEVVLYRCVPIGKAFPRIVFEDAE